GTRAGGVRERLRGRLPRRRALAGPGGPRRRAGRRGSGPPLPQRIRPALPQPPGPHARGAGANGGPVPRTRLSLPGDPPGDDGRVPGGAAAPGPGAEPGRGERQAPPRGVRPLGGAERRPDPGRRARLEVYAGRGGTAAAPARRAGRLLAALGGPAPPRPPARLPPRPPGAPAHVLCPRRRLRGPVAAEGLPLRRARRQRGEPRVPDPQRPAHGRAALRHLAGEARPATPHPPPGPGRRPPP